MLYEVEVEVASAGEKESELVELVESCWWVDINRWYHVGSCGMNEG